MRLLPGARVALRHIAKSDGLTVAQLQDLLGCGRTTVHYHLRPLLRRQLVQQVEVVRPECCPTCGRPAYQGRPQRLYTATPSGEALGIHGDD